MIDMKQLTKPFQPHEIDWRVGSTTKDKTKGMALAYMDARAVMDRLDAVCSPQGWQDRYPHVGGKTCCDIGIWFPPHNDYPGGWVWKSDGAGDTDYEGDKGAFSDAFKRAAFRWGIGRYLYSIKTPWVPIEQRGKSFVITDEGLTTLTREYRQAIWRGPLSITAFKDAFKAFVNHLAQSQSVDDMDNLVSANRDLLEQCEYDAPDWFHGKGDVPSVDERVATKRDELKMKEAA